MFEQMLLPSGGTHQARNTVLAFAGQAALVAIRDPGDSGTFRPDASETGVGRRS